MPVPEFAMASHEWVEEPLTRDGCVAGLSRQFAEELDLCLEEVGQRTNSHARSVSRSMRIIFKEAFESALKFPNVPLIFLSLI